MIKVAFTGTSGSGKTTLVKYLHKEYPLPWLNGSSGELLSKDDQLMLEVKHDYVGGKGHAHVIRQSHLSPAFGLDHQNMVLNRRGELIESNQDFVTDRSPLDNWVYFLLQAGLYQNMNICHDFMSKAIHYFSKLTHVIYVPAMLVDVEDNNSRVANYYYQRGVDSIFNSYWQAFTHHAKIANPSLKLMKIVDLDLKTRQEKVMDFVKRG